MPVGSIITQPSANQLRAAYRPILLRVNATATNGSAKPPVLYCDIYFGDVFYKTLSKTLYTKLNPLNSEWEFDIQDAAQEFLKKYIGENGLGMIIQVDQMITKCFCRFRSSGINADGFIQPEGTQPVQATGSTAAVSGTGTDSSSFYILNSSLQHEDNQVLFDHLSAFKKRTWTIDALPLSHRPDNYKQTIDDSDFFPIVYTGASIPASLVLNYRFRGQSTWRTAQANNVIACPNLVSLGIGLVDNGDGTQSIFISYPSLDSPAGSLTIGYRVQGSTGAFTIFSAVINTTIELDLPLGLYELQFNVSGACVSSSKTFQNVGIPSTPCTDVALVGSPSLPDGNVGAAYSYTINLTGTDPFTLSNIVKPSWMTIAISGSSVVLSGTPPATATGVSVSFRVNNCFSSAFVNFSDTINIAAALNAISLFIGPGSMDIGFTPASCWQWTGTVTIRNAALAVVATMTWSSHTDPNQQEEQLGALNLPNGNYTIEWALQSTQNCFGVLTDVDYVEDFGTPLNKAATDSQVVSLTGNITKQIQLIVNNG